MRLTEDDCRLRLGDARHATLSTVHPRRGVDAVPVVYATSGSQIFIPVDLVKAKTGRRLRRLANLATDPRCVVLVDHWSDDWSELWWVRAHGTGRVVEDAGHWQELLAGRYPQYADPASLAGGIVIDVTEMTGWAAG